MKKILGGVGTGLFWLLWPGWVLYFRLSGARSRVLVVCGGEALIVQGWLGSKNWSLPGGGSKKAESPVGAAVRELFEETGIEAAETSLNKLGAYKRDRYGLKYHGDLFCLELNEKPQLKLRWGEIWSARWIGLNDAKKLKLDDEARLALRRYRPLEQASLL